MSLAIPDGGIGAFDSGIGGLSVLREIRRELPNEHLLYVADSGFAPYGERSEEYIEERATAIVKFLLTHKVKAIVVACNTVTGVAIQKLRAWSPVPIVAIEPAIKPAAQQTQSGVIAVLATKRTLASDSVSRLCTAHGKDVKILLQACPGFVEVVEKAEFDTPHTRALVERFVQPLLDQNADMLVLGCTHYPFLIPLMQEIAGSGVQIIDPAPAVARELARRLGVEQLKNGSVESGRDFFWTSGSTTHAQSLISGMWGKSITVEALPSEYSRPISS